MKSLSLFLCVLQIVVCFSTPNRAKPDLTEEEFLENHDKFTGFLDNVQTITEDSPKVDEADDRSGGIHPLKDDLFNHKQACEHPKDLDCKLDSLPLSCTDANILDDPRCIKPEAADQVTEVEDKAVLGEPEAPEPVTESIVSITTEKALHATESSNLNVTDEQMTSKMSMPEAPEPDVNIATESSNLNVTDTSTPKPRMSINTSKPSNLTKENRTAVEDILIEEEEEIERLETLSNLTKEAEDRASSNTIVVQDIVEEETEEVSNAATDNSAEGGSPLLNFFKALFNN